MLSWNTARRYLNVQHLLKMVARIRTHRGPLIPVRAARSVRRLPRLVALIVAQVVAFCSAAAGPTSDPLLGVISDTGGAGLGFAARVEQSPYRDAGKRNDFLPLYLYEGKRLYLHAYRAGLKLIDEDNRRRLDVFLAHRFEGFPYDRVPSSLRGMAERQPGADVGVSYLINGKLGTVYGEYLHDISGVSEGNELRFGYNNEWRSGRLRLRPYLVFALRDAALNDYYYGVRPNEATVSRRAYAPGSGVNLELGLYGTYGLSERWRLLAGVSATRLGSGVRDSPIVDGRVRLAGMLGLMYDFSPEHEAWPEGRPLVVKAMVGKSSNCNLLPIMGLSCVSTNTVDQTRFAGLEIGRPFIEKLNGWPLDFTGYVGVLQHDERALQQDFLQINAYIKAFYYGFPWSDRVRTRLGFGIGVSYAQRLPFVEQRDQLARGRNTSKLLNYLDPSIDISVGDLLGVRSLHQTYLGFGVSHRSGVFGTSQLLGNVNGGSNYIYTYIEHKL
jgi:outer membrane protein